MVGLTFAIVILETGCINRLFAIANLGKGCINHQPPLQRGISMIQLHPVQIVGEDQDGKTGNERKNCKE